MLRHHAFNFIQMALNGAYYLFIWFLVGLEAWDPGNIGKRSILIAWEPGNTGKRSILTLGYFYKKTRAEK